MGHQPDNTSSSGTVVNKDGPELNQPSAPCLQDGVREEIATDSLLVDTGVGGDASHCEPCQSTSASEMPTCSGVVAETEQSSASWMYPSTWSWRTSSTSPSADSADPSQRTSSGNPSVDASQFSWFGNSSWSRQSRSESSFFSAVAAAKLLIWLFPDSKKVWSKWPNLALTFSSTDTSSAGIPAASWPSDGHREGDQDMLEHLSCLNSPTEHSVRSGGPDDVSTPRSILTTETSWSQYSLPEESLPQASKDSCTSVPTMDGAAPARFEWMQLSSWGWRKQSGNARSKVHTVSTSPLPEEEEEDVHTPKKDSKIDPSSEHANSADTLPAKVPLLSPAVHDELQFSSLRKGAKWTGKDSEQSQSVWMYPASWGWRARSNVVSNQPQATAHGSSSSLYSLAGSEELQTPRTPPLSPTTWDVRRRSASPLAHNAEIEGRMPQMRGRSESDPADPGFLSKMKEGLRKRRERKWNWSRERTGTEPCDPRSSKQRSHSAGLVGFRSRSMTPPSISKASSSDNRRTWTSSIRGCSDPPAMRKPIRPSEPAAVSYWFNPVTWIRDNVEYASWLYNDANFVLEAMAPKPVERQLPLQEFEMADLLQAGAKLADVGAVAAEISLFFWIFLIAFILVIASVLFAIMDLWVSILTSYLGWFAYVTLFCAVCNSWPRFFHYLIRTIIRGYYVKCLHERTVQLTGITAAHATQEAMEQFCQERNLPTTYIYVSRLKDKRVELMFRTKEDMKMAFTSKILDKDMKIGGNWVRVRPKAGTSSASVEWLLVLMEYLYESVPPRFWIRATVSCLISMSLTRTFLAAVLEMAIWCRSRLHMVVHLFGFMFSLVSLGFLFFFVGYHSYIDMAEAREDLRNEQRQDRLHCDPPAFRSSCTEQSA